MSDLDWKLPVHYGMKNSYSIRIDEFSLAILDLSDYFGQGLIINRINVPPQHRGLGYGRALLAWALADADRTGTTLWLEISPSGEMTYDQLAAWYQRNRFIGMGIYRRTPAIRRNRGTSL